MLAHACRGVVVLALVAGAAAPATAVEVTDTRDALSEARGELDDVERTVQRARDEVAAADERLRTATTELEAVRAHLADAEAAMGHADARERESAAALRAADDGLSTARTTWRDRRALFEARAVAAYKHGGAVPSEVLVRGVAHAGDWHDITVTMETVDRLVTADRELVEATADATRRAADARAEVTAARSEALTARRDAARERRRVERLAARREAVVAQVDDELARRAAALQRLEADAAARAVLVRDLERRVASLELAALQPVAPVTVDLDALGPAPAWAARLPEAGRTWSPAIEAAATAHGIDARLLAAVVWTESGFRPDAVSHAGALGLAQLMPGTARLLGVDPRDPLANLAGGAAYLRGQLDAFGRVDLALAAYNAGPGRVTAAGHRVPAIVETQLYVVRVLDHYERLAGR